MKKLFGYMRKMSEPSYFFIKICAIASCILAVAALALSVYIKSVGYGAYHLCTVLTELKTAPAAIILLAAIGSVCIEERCAK